MRISISLPQTHPVARSLLARTVTASHVAPLVRRDLGRYYALLYREGERLLQAFSSDELGAAIADCVTHPDYLRAVVAPDGASRFPAESTLHRIASLCLGRRLAFVDLVEQVMMAAGTGSEPAHAP